MKKLLRQLEERPTIIKFPIVAPIQEKMGESIANGNPCPIDGLLVGNENVKAMLQQFEQTALNPQLDGHAHGMCDKKMVVRRVDDRPQGSFVNYVLVAKQGHVGGILGVDKQVVKSHSTTVTTNIRADQAPHSKVCTL